MCQTEQAAALRHPSLQPCSITNMQHIMNTHDALQGASQSISHAPSHDKARLEELVIRQSKQLVPVVASASNRDKGKGKGPTATTPKLGVGSSAATLLGVRSKPGLDSAKRPEDATTGKHSSP